MPVEACTAPAQACAEAIRRAAGRIPPLWPLSRFVAVNPFAGLSEMPFEEACRLLQRNAGAAPLASPSAFKRHFEAGRIGVADLAESSDAAWPVGRLLAAIEAPQAASGAVPGTFAAQLDRRLGERKWERLVCEEVSKHCAAYFDENQTTWASPWKGLGLYEAWRQASRFDRNPEVAGLRGFRAWVERLPAGHEACIEACLQRLAAPGTEPADLLHRQLISVFGWACYAQHRVHDDRLRGLENPLLAELLAVRLAYDVSLLDAFGGDPGEPASEGAAPEAVPTAALVRWQRAYEAGYQRDLARRLAEAEPACGAGAPEFQAVFCIDVRSERIRRHLEASAPGCETVGFAGFFGFAVDHFDAATGVRSARCPVLLASGCATTDAPEGDQGADAAQARDQARAWKAFQNSTASCFTFVESAGLAFAVGLARLGRRRPAPLCRASPPRLADAGGSRAATLAAQAEFALRHMGLVGRLGRLVLLCGHGSQSANNPHASSLDCGACGGHSGDVNARLAAAALNDPEVRRLLGGRGIDIPRETWFVAGVHNTTTDDVELLDLAGVPGSHAGHVAALRVALARAARACRGERARGLGLGPDDEEGMRLRASDVSQVRPEWGLANNAAMVVGPRSRTRGLDLEGRVFLHDYDERQDPGGSVLELILRAPVIVASWINLQYYASTVDPGLYGSGNKTLHNVTGGVGVLEGNAGDLRPGLPLQSVHDGTRFVHELRRLSVFVEAQPSALDAVMARQPAVRALFENEWAHLFALRGDGCLRYRPGRGWEPA